MKYLLLPLFLFIFLGCQEEKKTLTDASNKIEKEEDCDSEEKVKKKLEEDLKKSEEGKAVSLLGGDTGCSLDEAGAEKKENF